MQAGVRFWAVSWWGEGRREDRTLNEKILTHPDAAQLRYAVLYESAGRLGRMESPDYSNLASDFAYLKEQYFDHPSYLRIDGKPVVFIYLLRVYFRNRGLGPLAERHARLWDAVTAYDVYGQSMQRAGSTMAAVKTLRGHFENARAMAGGVGTPFMSCIAPGYNDRAVRRGNVGRARHLADREGSKEGDFFRAMIEEVALPSADPRCGNVIMVTSFNEWYQDTQIEAAKGGAKPASKDDSESGTFFPGARHTWNYGTLYLDILGQFFRGAAE